MSFNHDESCESLVEVKCQNKDEMILTLKGHSVNVIISQNDLLTLENEKTEAISERPKVIVHYTAVAIKSSNTMFCDPP